jgi:hypothetical protein
MANAGGRLDDIIRQLEKLYGDAQAIFDSHVEDLRRQKPNVPFGILKANEIARPAGSALNYVAALKMLREKFTGQNEQG